MAYPNFNPSVVNILKEKASKSACTYHVSAIAFDKKGNILGHATNSHSRNWDVLEKCEVGRGGTAEHAEKKLFARYGSNIKTVLICRTGRSGILRPIDPCPNCKKIARKYGAKIISILGS